MSIANFEVITSGGIVTEGIVLLAKLLKKDSKARRYSLIISMILEILGIAVIVLNEVFWKSNDNILIITVILLVCCSYVLLAAVSSYFISDSNITLSEKLLELAEERNELNKKMEKNMNIMDVIKINLNQLNEYYTINKGQARKSYSFSVIMITIGFVAIIGGITLCYSGKTGVNIAIISSASGLIAEFIGATSLLLYKESSKQAQVFFEELSYLQHVMLAVELSNKLKDEKREEETVSIISALIQKRITSKNKE